MRSLQKSTHEAVCESRSTKHAILSVLHKELNYRPWNSHYVQELKPADCDRKMGWHGVFLIFFKNTECRNAVDISFGRYQQHDS